MLQQTRPAPLCLLHTLIPSAHHCAGSAPKHLTAHHRVFRCSRASEPAVCSGPSSGIMLAAGGASESLLTQPGCYDLVWPQACTAFCTWFLKHQCRVSKGLQVWILERTLPYGLWLLRTAIVMRWQAHPM